MNGEVVLMSEALIRRLLRVMVEANTIRVQEYRLCQCLDQHILFMVF
jgi:hypothetical protein